MIDVWTFERIDQGVERWRNWNTYYGIKISKRWRMEDLKIWINKKLKM